MKRMVAGTKIVLALVVSSLSFEPALAQKKHTVKKVEITPQTVARQPRSKPYVVDLTRRGTIYTVASDVDYNKVLAHTAKGDMTIADLIEKSGKRVSGRLRIGMTSDIRSQKLNLKRARGGLNYSCSDVVCLCTDDEDCNNMFTFGPCGPIAICYPDGCICIRF